MEDRPKVLSGYPLLDSLDFKMASQEIIIIASNRSELDDFRHIRETLIIKYALYIFSAFW